MLIAISIIFICLVSFSILYFYKQHKNKLAEIENQKPYSLENIQVKEDFGFSEKIKNYSVVENDTFLYKKPDVASNTKIEVKKGSYLKTYGTEENFSKINYDNKIYYVKTQDLKNVSKDDEFKVVNGILIVNSKYSLPKDFEPGVNKFVIEQFNIMSTDAKRDGLNLKIIKDYVSYEQQKDLYSKVEKLKDDEYGYAYETKAGHNESQTGESLDLGNDNSNMDYNLTFQHTEEFKWLEKNAHKYGFILRYPKEKEEITNFKFSPWHFRFVGVENAKEIHENKFTLEEFLKN